MKKRVVVTGMEVTSSIGCGLDNFWQAAVHGHCGIQRVSSYDPSPYSTQIAGEIKEFSDDTIPEILVSKRYPKVAKYGLYCVHNALKQANLSSEELKHAGTFIGTSLGGTPEAYETFYHNPNKKLPALSVVRGMPNSIANHIAIAFGIEGPNSTISNACVSSAEAIGYAYRQITQGYVNAAICGGTESLIWETVMNAWCKLRVMSTQNEQPKSACKPFDKNRDGLVMADGAGILILEEYEQARARGATILAEIIGYGASCDAYHVTAPNSQGQIRSIQIAMQEAKISAQDIQYIQAHGTGTQLNDKTETQTIKTIFQKQAYNIPITALKAMTGHAIGAAGVMQIIATILSLQKGILLPTLNLHAPDPECDLDYIPNQPRRKSIDIALSNHFAFGGANAALILQRAA